MRFKFEIECEVSRTEGKFESRETIAQALQDAIEQSDPGSISGDNGGEYSVDSFEVSEVTVKKLAL